MVCQPRPGLRQPFGKAALATVVPPGKQTVEISRLPCGRETNAERLLNHRLGVSADHQRSVNKLARGMRPKTREQPSRLLFPDLLASLAYRFDDLLYRQDFLQAKNNVEIISNFSQPVACSPLKCLHLRVTRHAEDHTRAAGTQVGRKPFDNPPGHLLASVPAVTVNHVLPRRRNERRMRTDHVKLSPLHRAVQVAAETADEGPVQSGIEFGEKRRSLRDIGGGGQACRGDSLT